MDSLQIQLIQQLPRSVSVVLTNGTPTGQPMLQYGLHRFREMRLVQKVWNGPDWPQYARD